MWQRFTERARKVVFYAQEEAQKFGEGYVSTEHLLLGLCREEDSVAARLLETLGLTRDRVRIEIERQLPKGDARPSQDMTLTPRAKRVIDLSYDGEARNLNNNYIGTEHLLLGLIREADGLAGRVLMKLGVDLERVRAETVKLQSDERGKGKDPTSTQPSRSNPLAASMEQWMESRRWFKMSSKEAKKIFELAAVEANSVGLPSLSGSHLLLGILLEGDGKAARVLSELGITVEQVRESYSAVNSHRS